MVNSSSILKEEIKRHGIVNIEFQKKKGKKSKNISSLEPLTWKDGIAFHIMRKGVELGQMVKLILGTPKSSY